MFDKLLKTKFYTKSKSAIKLTKTRIATIKRKRNSMQKYLKKDIADLLKNNLDVNAYGRVEGLWNELNLSSCYDFVEQFCTHISTNLTTIDKQRECPDECREAVSTLMFAAARFADLPELRDLRNVFLKRYGDSIQHYANKEFIYKLKSTTPPTKDMKLQLIQDIATESGVEWNVKDLEQKLFNPPADFDKESTEGTNPDERSTTTPDMIDIVHNMDEKDADYIKLEDPRNATQAMEIVCLSPTKEFHGGQEAIEPAKDNQVDKTVDTKEQMSSSGEEEVVDMRPFYFKPIHLPSYKSKIINNIPDVPSNNTDLEISEQDADVIAVKEDDLHQRDSITEAKPKPKSVRTRNQKAPPGQDSIDSSDTRKSESVLEPFPQQTALRTASLPANSEAVETTKRNDRAGSFRPEMLRPKEHVQSNPLDYEEFVARLAVFRENLN